MHEGRVVDDGTALYNLAEGLDTDELQCPNLILLVGGQLSGGAHVIVRHVVRDRDVRHPNLDALGICRPISKNIRKSSN